MIISISICSVGHKGYEVNTIDLPKADDLYVVNAFSMSPTYGFGLIEGPIEVRFGLLVYYKRNRKLRELFFHDIVEGIPFFAKNASEIIINSLL